jgi:hypothetical protein
MRVSADSHDPDFVGSANFGRYQVLLNGKETKYVITASEEGGYIVRHQRDEAGEMVINGARNDLIRETVRGHVRVVDTLAHADS